MPQSERSFGRFFSAFMASRSCTTPILAPLPNKLIEMILECLRIASTTCAVSCFQLSKSLQERSKWRRDAFPRSIFVTAAALLNPSAVLAAYDCGARELLMFSEVRVLLSAIAAVRISHPSGERFVYEMSRARRTGCATIAFNSSWNPVNPPEVMALQDISSA
jgi:hypothetical protein